MSGGGALVRLNFATRGAISPSDGLAFESLVFDPNKGEFVSVPLSAVRSGATTQRSVTATPIVIASSDQTLNCNINVSATCALPPAASRNGIPLTFKDLGQAAAHPIVISANGSETIDGQSSITLNSNFQSVMLVPFADGVHSGWETIGGAAGGGGTPGGSSGQVQINSAGAFGGLTNAQLTALVNPFSSVVSGAAPASGGGSLNFLRADGSWAAPPPGGSSGQVQVNNAGAFGGLTNAQLTALVNPFSASLPGDAPASGGGTTNFLRADGSWAAPPATNPAGSNLQVQFNNAGAFGGYTGAQLTALINSFTSTLSGAAPASGGGTTNFLRADGTWTVPAGGGNVVGPGSSTTGHIAVFADGTGHLLADGGAAGTLGVQSALSFGADNGGIVNNDTGSTFATNWVAQGNTLTSSFPIPVTQMVPNPLQMIAQAALVPSGSPVKVDSYANDPGQTNAPVPAGSTIVVIITATGVANNAISGLIDSAGNTYTQVVQNTAAAGVGSAAIFWCQSTTHDILGGVAFFVATVAGANQTYGLWAFKLINGATAINASSSTTGTGTTFSLSTGTLSANSLVLAFSYPFQSAPPRVTPATGFNQLDNLFLGGGINWAFHASGSGLTFNAPAFNSVPFAGLIAAFTVPSLTPACPTLVTMTTGIQSQDDIIGHGLRLAEPFQFSGTGTLDANLSKGTTYFTVHSAFTAYQFQFSTVNTGGLGWFEGNPVTSTTSYVAPIGVVPLALEWVQLAFPPGTYNFNNGGGSSLVLVNGQKRLRVSGYGAETQGGLGANALMGQAWSGDTNAWAQIQTASQGPAQSTEGINTLQMLNLQTAQWFYPNHWILIMAGDCEAGSNFAPDNFYNQYEKMRDYDPATGRIFFTDKGRLRDTYRQSLPTYYPMNRATQGGSSFSFNRGTAGPYQVTGGGATVYFMPTRWDCEVLYEGFHFSNPPDAQTDWAAREITLSHMTADNLGVSVAQSKRMVMEYCTFGSGAPTGQHTLQIDKVTEEAVFRYCVMDTLNALSSGTQKVEYDHCKMVALDAAGSRCWTMRYTIISVLTIGALYGICEQGEIKNSHVTFLTPANANFGNPYGNFLPFFSFSNGTLRYPFFEGGTIYFGIASWAIPGAKMFFCTTSNNDNAGSPFVVTDVYVSGGNICIDTTLAALPAPTNNKSSIVTITSGSPAVINWTAHGNAAGTLIQLLGNTPVGLANFEQSFLPNNFFVLATGLTANSFQVALSPGGTPINTTPFSDDYSLCLASFKASGTIGTPVRFGSTFPIQQNNAGAPLFVNAPVPAGSLIVVQVSNYTANTALPGGTPLTDSVGNTYNKAVESTAATGTLSTAIYYCASCIALQYGDFIKFNLSGYGMQACYVANANGGLDVALATTLANGNVSGLSLATGTLATANEIIFYGWQSVNGVGFGGASTTYDQGIGAGWHTLTSYAPYGFNGQGSRGSDFGYKVVAATTTQTFNPTMNIWAVANPMFIGKHPCPKFTACNNTGGPQINDLEGANSEPIFSRFKRSYGGFNGAGVIMPQPIIWGSLVTLTINVRKPWTGGGACLFEVDIFGRDANLNSSNASLVIDCTHAGIRTITPTAATGAQGIDSIAAFANWISTVSIPTPTTGWTGPLSQQPFVEVICRTDQGITTVDNIAVQGPNDNVVFMLSDSSAHASTNAGP